MKIDPTQSVKNQVKNYIKIQEGLEHTVVYLSICAIKAV